MIGSWLCRLNILTYPSRWKGSAAAVYLTPESSGLVCISRLGIELVHRGLS